jgi:hypothetical protein
MRRSDNNIRINALSFYEYLKCMRFRHDNQRVKSISLSFIFLFSFVLIEIYYSYGQINIENLYFYSNFENGNLNPQKGRKSLSIEHGRIFVDNNPKKDKKNSSDKVLVVSTPKSEYGKHARAEYRNSGRIITNQKHHIYQWMVFFPEDYLKGIDKISGTWQIIAQFGTSPCEDGSTDEYSFFADSICGHGGMFNEIRINRNDRNVYGFEIRAYPDCYEMNFTYMRDEWIKFTYEVYWTTEFNGYYRFWINEELQGYANNVRTLPGGWEKDICDIFWKVGLYDSWTDSENDSVFYYLDNLEIYIDKDISVACEKCALVNSSYSSEKEFDVVLMPGLEIVQIEGLKRPMEIKIYDSNRCLLKTVLEQNKFSISEFKPGVYEIEVKTGSNVYRKKIVKY